MIHDTKPSSALENGGKHLQSCVPEEYNTLNAGRCPRLSIAAAVELLFRVPWLAQLVLGINRNTNTYDSKFKVVNYCGSNSTGQDGASREVSGRCPRPSVGTDARERKYWSGDWTLDTL